jgi:hypothetical protein
LFLDRYPPFAMGAGKYEGMTFEMEQEDSYSRLLIFLLIPHVIVLYLFELVTYLAGFAMV